MKILSSEDYCADNDHVLKKKKRQIYKRQIDITV